MSAEHRTPGSEGTAERLRETAMAGLRSRDAATSLPDRRGWASMLQAEETRPYRSRTPGGVVMVDVGTVLSSRGLARAADIVIRHAGGLPTARVGRRQLGVLAGGRARRDVARLATTVVDGLVDGGFAATAAHCTRGESESLVDTWARAEQHLRREIGADPGSTV